MKHFAVESFPSNSSTGTLLFNCTTEGCGKVKVELPLATSENYTFAESNGKVVATLNANALSQLTAKYPNIKDLSTRLSYTLGIFALRLYLVFCSRITFTKST